MFLKYRISIRGLLIFLRFSQSNTSTSPKEKKPNANWYNKHNPLNIHKLHFWKMTWHDSERTLVLISFVDAHIVSSRSVPQNVNPWLPKQPGGKSSFPKVHFWPSWTGAKLVYFFGNLESENASNLDLSGKNGAENQEPKKTKRTSIRLWLWNNILMCFTSPKCCCQLVIVIKINCLFGKFNLIALGFLQMFKGS